MKHFQRQEVTTLINIFLVKRKYFEYPVIRHDKNETVYRLIISLKSVTDLLNVTKEPIRKQDWHILLTHPVTEMMKPHANLFHLRIDVMFNLVHVLSTGMIRRRSTRV